MENNNKQQKGKTGIVPNNEIKGSDADKAYDEDGNFGTTDLEKEPEKSEVPPTTDSDS